LFDGEDYHPWAVRMEEYLEGCNLWETVGGVNEIPIL